MKIYIDKMPKSCWDCPCHNGEDGRCKLLGKFTDYVPIDCPLQSINIEKILIENEELKFKLKIQPREIVEKIKQKLREQVTEMSDNEHCYLQKAVHWQDIVEVLGNIYDNPELLEGKSDVKD